MANNVCCIIETICIEVFPFENGLVYFTHAWFPFSEDSGRSPSLPSFVVAVLCRRPSMLGILWGNLIERMELRAMGIKKEAFEQASKALDSYNTLSEKIAHAI